MPTRHPLGRDVPYCKLLYHVACSLSPAKMPSNVMYHLPHPPLERGESTTWPLHKSCKTVLADLPHFGWPIIHSLVVVSCTTVVVLSSSLRLANLSGESAGEKQEETTAKIWVLDIIISHCCSVLSKMIL